jgi:ribonuclease E
MRRMKKFSEGGKASRAERMRERRMADIEKDYKIALAKGKSEKVAQAKRDQRIADAKDDFAKRTGADRTETRAAEKAAQARLRDTRRAARRGTLDDTPKAETSAPKAETSAPKAETSAPKAEPSAPKSYDDMTFGAAFRQAMKDKGPGGTFMWRGQKKKLEYADSKKAPAASKSGPSYDPQALRNLVDEQTKPGARAGSTNKLPSDSALVKGTGASTAPQSARAPLRGFAAIAERRRKAEQARRAPPSETAKRAAALRELTGSKMAKGGKVKGYARGGKIDGCAVRGKTRAMRKK